MKAADPNNSKVFLRSVQRCLILLVVGAAMQLPLSSKAEGQSASAPLTVQDSDPFVSVNQLHVPAKAQVELEKSGQAYRQGDRLSAMKHVDRALALHSSYAKALAWRGVLESEDQALFQLACSDLEEAVRYDPSLTSAYTALGTLYNNMARWDEARSVLDRALRLRPRFWQAYYELARTDAGQMKNDSALRHLQTAMSLSGDAEQVTVLQRTILAGGQ